MSLTFNFQPIEAAFSTKHIYPCTCSIIIFVVSLKLKLMEFRRSFRLSKSERILLSSESVTSQFAAYERLSQSMRLNEEYKKNKTNQKGTRFLSKVLTFTRISTPHEEHEIKAKKEKKRSSWLPDPHKRWPIQGW